ncbi:homoserine O-succinyltransferase [Sutterella sp.]|uniref:homoserine O-acetyltransferase MetA n=1 Tax=Sutterella sp. TaxID=1981025 RepID=UPI0026E0ED48|nr:homoserine O-succinyltransferase [Sutterella sp.]MDO5532958.1 homoserine O-succinyltransferase [Sutterella sp.]
MPVILPRSLPAYTRLGEENVFVMTPERARTQDIRPLEIAVLNLMPTKITTETQIARLLANSPLQVNLTLMQTKSHRATHVSGDHLDAFYTTFDEVRHRRFDGMIITGAPIEQYEFEDVKYWEELTEILDWTRTHVFSTMHLCWGAFAGLWHHFGIRKKPLAEKLFGLFEHEVMRPNNPLVRGFDDVFLAPHSRHTGLNLRDLEATPALRVLAGSRRTGPFLMSTENGRQIFVTGHPEYDLLTLDAEYRRDLAKGLAIAVPENYYPDDDPNRTPRFRWRGHAHLLYSNWLNYYVYQTTPYDLDELKTSPAAS